MKASNAIAKYFSNPNSIIKDIIRIEVTEDFIGRCLFNEPCYHGLPDIYGGHVPIYLNKDLPIGEYYLTFRSGSNRIGATSAIVFKFNSPSNGSHYKHAIFDSDITSIEFYFKEGNWLLGSDYLPYQPNAQERSITKVIYYYEEGPQIITSGIIKDEGDASIYHYATCEVHHREPKRHFFRSNEFSEIISDPKFVELKINNHPFMHYAVMGK